MKQIIQIILTSIIIAAPIRASMESSNGKYIAVSNSKPGKSTNTEAEIFDRIFSKSLEDGMRHLNTRDLAQLDPLVGDTACHMRVPRIIALYRKAQAQQVPLSASEKEFLTLCRLLTISKEIVYKNGIIDKEKTQYKQVDPTLTKKMGELLIKKTQDRLAQLTVIAMQEAAAQLGDQELMRAVSEPCIKIDNEIFKRRHCACYVGLKIMLLTCIAQKIPLLISIQRSVENQTHTVYFLYKVVNNNYVAALPEEFDLAQPVLRIEGYSKDLVKPLNIEEFITAFCELDIVQVVLKNGAAHTQYVGKQKETDIPFEECQLVNLKKEMTQLRELAQNGYSQKNPSVFAIDHIYAQTMGNIVQMDELAPKAAVRKLISAAILAPEVVKLITDYAVGPTL